MNIRSAAGLAGLAFCIFGSIGSYSAHAEDFRQKYLQGKMLFKQKLYTDTLREMRRLQKTPRGQRHFGVHYHIAVSLYFRGNIRESRRFLKKSWSLAKRTRHRASVRRVMQRVSALFGRVVFRAVPQAGSRIRLKLQATENLHHPHKKLVLRMLKKRWSTVGVKLDGQPVYLPQGAYRIEMGRPTCHKLAFGSSGSATLSLNLRVAASVSLIAKPGCGCRAPLVWSSSQNKCIRAVVPKVRTVTRAPSVTRTPSVIRTPAPTPAPASRRSLSWVWVSLAGAAVITGGALAIHFLVVEPQQRKSDPASLTGQLWKGSR